LGTRVGVEECRKISLTGIRSLDNPVESESLDLLRYVGPVYENYYNNNNNTHL